MCVYTHKHVICDDHKLRNQDSCLQQKQVRKASSSTDVLPYVLQLKALLFCSASSILLTGVNLFTGTQ
jgi:hypothetical protein